MLTAVSTLAAVIVFLSVGFVAHAAGAKDLMEEMKREGPMTRLGSQSGVYCDRRFHLKKWPALRRRRALTAILLLLCLSLGNSAGHAALAAKNHAKDHVHVYLIRGVLNIFSLGLDEIASKLQRQGIQASVHNHLAWPLVANEAAAEYKSGKARTIILVGHSAGADAIVHIAAQLGQEGIPVKMVIGLDPVLSPLPASGHVEHYINYYVSTGAGHRVVKSPQFRGNLRNVAVARPGIGHFNIDKAALMEDKVMRDIHTALIH